jgi:hypothetical protein
MRKTIGKHKTTITASITALLCLGACVRWYMGQIDAMELQSFCTTAGIVSGILIGMFAKDGEVKQKPKP